MYNTIEEEKERGRFGEMTDGRTDRSEEVCPSYILSALNTDICLSPFASDLLSFTVYPKIEKLECATDSLISATNDSHQLDALKKLATLIREDPRLGDHLNLKVIPHLLNFLKDKKSHADHVDDDMDMVNVDTEDKNRFDFQFNSALVLKNILTSKKGIEFHDEAIPSFLNLILSSDTLVQVQAMNTMTFVAMEFPNSCNTMINNGGLELLESLLTNELEQYDCTSLESGGQLLSAFCEMKPYLPSDELKKVLYIISIAIRNIYMSVIREACLALSILSDRRLVVIGTEFIRLNDLILHQKHQISISALRTIGNYVRWGRDEDLQLMIGPCLLAVLGELLCHEYTIVRKEACWIISNITAVANTSQIQEVIDLGLIDTLVEVVRDDEFEVKEVAACAISNAVCGSDKKQFECIKKDCFGLLYKIRCDIHDDPRTETLCSKLLLELDNTHDTEISSEILKPVSVLTNREGRSNIRAYVTSASDRTSEPTAKSASANAKYAQRNRKARLSTKHSSSSSSSICSKENLGSYNLKKSKKLTEGKKRCPLMSR